MVRRCQREVEVGADITGIEVIEVEVIEVEVEVIEVAVTVAVIVVVIEVTVTVAVTVAVIDTAIIATDAIRYTFVCCDIHFPLHGKEEEWTPNSSSVFLFSCRNALCAGNVGCGTKTAK